VNYDEEKELEAAWDAKKRELARLEEEMYPELEIETETETESETGLYFSLLQLEATAHL